MTIYASTKQILKHSISYLSFLKHLPKNILAIFTICDDVSILRFRYMLRSNPKHSGGRDRSNYTRRQINLYRMFFADFSVNSQPILMKFCKDYFRVTRRLVYREIFRKNIM